MDGSTVDLGDLGPSEGADSPPDTWWHADFPWAAESAGAARAVIRTSLRHPPAGRSATDLRLVTDDAIEDAALVATELIANAIDHGDPGAEHLVHLAWALAPHDLVLRVRDSGRGAPFGAAAPTTDGLRGRGLLIVDSVCRRWDVVRDGGTTVTALVPLDAVA
ncbi:MAG TPA: ATP-binding protein [Nocardioides sp.]